VCTFEFSFVSKPECLEFNYAYVYKSRYGLQKFVRRIMRRLDDVTTDTDAAKQKKILRLLGFAARSPRPQRGIRTNKLQ
jgi:hypothetical protein